MTQLRGKAVLIRTILWAPCQNIPFNPVDQFPNELIISKQIKL